MAKVISIVSSVSNCMNIVSRVNNCMDIVSSVKWKVCTQASSPSLLIGGGGGVAEGKEKTVH